MVESQSKRSLSITFVSKDSCFALQLFSWLCCEGQSHTQNVGPVVFKELLGESQQQINWFILASIIACMAHVFPYLTHYSHSPLSWMNAFARHIVFLPKRSSRERSRDRERGRSMSFTTCFTRIRFMYASNQFHIDTWVRCRVSREQNFKFFEPIIIL